MENRQNGNCGYAHLVPRDSSLVSRGLRYIKEDTKPAYRKTIQISDISDLHLVRKIGEGAILKHVVSPDGSTIVVWSVAGVFVHHCPGGRKKGYLQIDKKVECLDVSHDNRSVALGLEDGRIVLWRYEGGNETKEIISDYDGVRIVKFSPISKFLVAVYSNEHREYPIALLDVDNQTSTPICTCKDRPYEIGISPNNRYLITHPGFGFPQLWDLSRGRFVRPVNEHGIDELPVFSRDTRFIGTMGTPIGRISKIETGKIVEQWDLRDDEREPAWVRGEYDRQTESKQAIKALDQYTSSIRCLEFSPECKFIASGGEDNKVRIWNIETGRLAKTFFLDNEDTFEALGWSKPINSLSYSPDSKFLAVGRGSGEVLIIDTDSGDAIQDLEGHPGGLFGERGPCVKFSHDGHFLGTGGLDGRLIIWNPSDWSILWSAEADKDKSQKSVLAITFSNDNKIIASGGMDGTVRLWDTRNGNLVTELIPTESSDVMVQSLSRQLRIYSISFTQDNKHIVARDQSCLAVYDLKTGVREVINSTSRGGTEDESIIDRLERWAEANRDFAIAHRLSNTNSGLSPNGSVWAIGCREGEIQLWDLLNKNIAHKLIGHQGTIDCTVFSSDGRLLASGGQDGVICIWGV